MTGSSAPPEVPAEIEPVAFLLGTWRGRGHGTYPTISAFDFGEELRFACPGRPFLVSTQRTWSLDDGRPLHAETGYWRPRPAGGLEVVIAQPTGIVEVLAGAARATTIELESLTVATTPSAKAVSTVRRVLRVQGDALRYELHMAAVGQPLQLHLTGELRRLDT